MLLNFRDHFWQKLACFSTYILLRKMLLKSRDQFLTKIVLFLLNVSQNRVKKGNFGFYNVQTIAINKKQQKSTQSPFWGPDFRYLYHFAMFYAQNVYRKKLLIYLAKMLNMARMRIS